ncbi:MAG: hypothetical protein K6B44_04735 [Lachnospiraceae bacterium]|nr:hypothetical protein [Lachnospiraceae bacterium]
MNCPICGAVLNEGAKFCGNCGNKLEAVQQPVQPAVAETPAAPIAPAAPVEQPSIFDQPVQQPVQPAMAETPAAPIAPAAPVEQPSIFDQPVQPVQNAFVQQGQIQQPADNTFVQPQPMAGGGYGGNNYIQNNYTQDTMKQPEVKKKGKTGLIIFLVVLAVLIVALGVTLFIFRGSLKNIWARLTKSPDEYLKYVITENLEESLDSMEDVQKEAMDILSKMDDVNMQGNLRVEIDDEILDKLEDASAAILPANRYGSSYDTDYYDYYDDYYDTDMYDKYDSYDEYYQAEHGSSKSSGGNGMNLSAYGDIGLNADYDRKGNVLGLSVGVQVKGGSDVIGAEGVFDGDNYTVYGRIPQLNKNYLMVDLKDIVDKNNLKTVDEVLAATADLSAMAMDPKAQRSMYLRYTEALLKPIDKVKASKVKLSVNGSKMSCRAYEFTLDDKLYQDMLLSVIDEIKNDRDLEKYFEDYFDTFDFANVRNKPDWDSFLDSLDEAEDKIQDMDFDEEFTCTFYITNAGKITGFAMTGEDEKDPHFSLAWYINGTKLDVELTSDFTDKNDKTEFMDIKGGGSVKSGKFSGEFELDLSLLDDKVEFSVEDLEILDKKNPGGTFRIGLEQFMAMAGDAADEIPDSIKKADLVISASGTIRDRSLSIGLENGSKNVVKFTMDSKISESQGMAVPSAKESVQIDEKTGETELIKYLKDSDLEKVVSGLETLGLPDSYADQIRQITSMLDYYN